MAGVREAFRFLTDDRRGQAVSALLLLAATFAAGLVVSSRNAASAQEASAAESDASAAAFGAARSTSWTEQFAAGIEDGLLAGERKGAEQGGDQGRDEALAVLAQGQGERSESKRGIGYKGAGGAELDGDGGVLVVGDSLEVLTGPYLGEYIPKGVELTHNALGGYNSLQIFGLFQESYDPSQSVIVFDAGTNDNPNYPEILADRLKAVAKIVGNRCMVVPTIHGLNVDRVGDAGKNRVVQQFAASRTRTQTPDWAGAVRAHPEMMQADGLHPTAEGAALRASLIADGVQACLAYGGR